MEKIEQPRLSFQDNKPTFLSHKFHLHNIIFHVLPFPSFHSFSSLGLKPTLAAASKSFSASCRNNAPQQRKNSAKTYVLSFAFFKLANGENAHTSLYSHLFLSEIAEQTILLESSSQF